MFNKVIVKLTSIKNLCASQVKYELEDLINILTKLEVRYNKYESALKLYANPSNWTYDNEFQGDSYYTAKEALMTDEELQKEQIKKITNLLNEFDKEVIIKVLSSYAD